MENRPTEYFVKEVSPNFMCSICLSVMGNPYDTPCQHTFCFSCISAALKARSTCCDCRAPLSLKLLKPSNFRFKSLLYEQRTYCDNKDFDNPEKGCKWVGEWTNLRDHLKNGCSFVTIPCVYECGKAIRKCDIEQHQAEECEKSATQCKFCKATIRKCDQNAHLQVCTQVVLECKCGGEILRKEMDNHLSTYCPEAMISCSYSQIGCKYQSSRKNMMAHIQSTEMQHVEMISKILQQQTYKFKKDMDDIVRVHETKIRLLGELHQDEKAELVKEIHSLNTKTQQLLSTNNKLMSQMSQRESFGDENKKQFERLKIEFLKEKEQFAVKVKPHERNVADLALNTIALILLFLALCAFITKVHKF